MTVAPAHIPVPLKIVPTNIIRQAANQVMSGMQTTKPVPATRRFTNMTVPAPTKRAAVRPATANINPVPVLTARAGTAANVSAIQVTNIPAPAPMKAQAAQVVTGNISPVPAVDRMSGTEVLAAAPHLISILVREPIKPAAKEQVAVGGTNNVHAQRQWNGDMIHGNTQLCAYVPVLINTAAAGPARKAGELPVTTGIHIVIASMNIIHGINLLNPAPANHRPNAIVSATVQLIVQTVNLLLTTMLNVQKLLIMVAAENVRNGEKCRI